MNSTSNPENNPHTTDNSNELLNLIQSIQSKLNVENNKNQNESENNNEPNTNNTNNFSNLLQNIDISTIINSFSGNNSSDKKNNDEFKFDESTIYKIQRIISSINKEDPKKNLLLSLKPFLRKSRQDKIGEYITLLTVANAIGIFDRKGSDNNE